MPKFSGKMKADPELGSRLVYYEAIQSLANMPGEAIRYQVAIALSVRGSQPPIRTPS